MSIYLLSLALMYDDACSENIFCVFYLFNFRYLRFNFHFIFVVSKIGVDTIEKKPSEVSSKWKNLGTEVCQGSSDLTKVKDIFTLCEIPIDDVRETSSAAPSFATATQPMLLPHREQLSHLDDVKRAPPAAAYGRARKRSEGAFTHRVQRKWIIHGWKKTLIDRAGTITEIYKYTVI